MKRSATASLTLLLVIAACVAGAQRAEGVPSDAHGKVKRSGDARFAFERQTGYPHGRPGYVIDHIVPLATGGADSPGNMQWQTKADALAKDRTERRLSSRASGAHPNHPSPGPRRSVFGRTGPGARGGGS
ncbi:MAG: hypothetical protein NVS4B3_28640 [Gemmatimonadaceae bacterium]